MESKLQSVLYDVLKPYQYIGEEYSSYNKDFDSVKVRIALAFPDKYEIGISNLGQKIIYDCVNRQEAFMADRVYAPDKDFRELLIKNDILLSTLESKRNVKDFDFIGFSLQYELAYPTVLEMLRLSGIPVKWEERSNNMPIIIAGGPSCFNPKPIQDFIDIFMIGDGEELIVELLTLYQELKEAGKTKNEIIKGLSGLEGVYAPLNPKKTKKRIYNISKDNHIVKAPIPYCSSVQDRSVVEIRRGCGRMCRFCQAGHVTLPIREREPQDIIDMVKDSTLQSGYNEYSLLSLSSNDYPNIEGVIETLSEDMNKKRISVSLPSQRIDRYSTKLAQLVRGVRATTTTLAPEAGSQRLRDVINKNLTETQIIDTVLSCYSNGVSNIKLYFMIGLPTETYQDIDEMGQLLATIRYKSKQLKKEQGLTNGLNITCTLSIFVPKPFTPFQWCKQDSREVIRGKIGYLLEKTKHIKGVKINYHNGFTSKLECAISRGDERYNKFIFALHNKGVYLSSWDENIDKTLWEETAKEYGLDLDTEAQREYPLNEELPWDIIDTGLDKTWLIEQYNNAMQAIKIQPCEFNCVKCGVCKNLKTNKILVRKKLENKEPKTVLNQKDERVPIKYRLKLTKEKEMKFISHLDWQNTITKMLYRSNLELCFSQGFNPTPKFSLGIALPLFIESKCELIDIEIYNDIEESELVKKLNNVLPKNIRILKAKKIDKTALPIDILVQWARYSFQPLKNDILKKEDLLYIKDRILSSNEIVVEKVNKKGVKKLVNILPSIKAVDIVDDKLVLVLKVGNSEEIPMVRADDLIKKLVPGVQFEIERNAFYDWNMNKI